MVRFFSLLFYLCAVISCAQPNTENNTNTMKNTKKTVTLISSLPSPTPSTTAMFHIVEENGSYETPEGTKEGVVVLVYSTDNDDLPKHRVGEGSEFELVGYRYKVARIIRSEDYTKSKDKVELTILGPVGDQEEEE